MKLWTVGGAIRLEYQNEYLLSKIAVVNVRTVLYPCAKFQNFPRSGSVGCHRLTSWRTINVHENVLDWSVITTPACLYLQSLRPGHSRRAQGNLLRRGTDTWSQPSERTSTYTEECQERRFTMTCSYWTRVGQERLTQTNIIIHQINCWCLLNHDPAAVFPPNWCHFLEDVVSLKGQENI